MSCGGPGRDASGANRRPGQEARPSKQTSLERAQSAARRARRGADEHVDLANTIAARLEAGPERDRKLGVLREQRARVDEAARDAELSASNALHLANYGGHGSATEEQARALAARAEQDLAEVEKHVRALKSVAAKLDGGDPSVADTQPAAGCVDGSVACSAPTPYCCMTLGKDSRPSGGGRCVAAMDDCKGQTFACRSHDQCPSEYGVSSQCGQFDEAACPPPGPCECTFLFAKSDETRQGEQQALQQFQESNSCVNVADCERFCRRDLKESPKIRSGACDRLVNLAEQMANGVSGPAGVAQGLAIAGKVCDADLVPAGGAREHQERACRMAGLAFAAGQSVKLDVVKAARFYKRACELTNAGSDCDRARITACGVETMTRARRAPRLDSYCDSGRGKAYLPADPSEPLYRDACADAMRSFECRGTIAGEKHVYCCPADNP